MVLAVIDVPGNERLYVRGCLFLKLLHYRRVDVHGESDRGVTEDLGHDLGRLDQCQQDGCGAVA
jgi:hypothetical protein